MTGEPLQGQADGSLANSEKRRCQEKHYRKPLLAGHPNVPYALIVILSAICFAFPADWLGFLEALVCNHCSNLPLAADRNVGRWFRMLLNNMHAMLKNPILILCE